MFWLPLRNIIENTFYDMISNNKNIWFVILCLVLLVPVLCCCSGNKPFKVNVMLQGLGAQNLRLVYMGDDGGIVDTWVKCEQHKFSFEGQCSSPSLMVVYNSINIPILKLIINSGDEIDVEGKVLDLYDLKVKGSDELVQYNSFMVKHKVEYNSANKDALNTSIENFVKDNPKSVVSTLLVLFDYSPADDTKVDKLLESIDASAKPETLMASYNNLKSREKKPITTISSLNMIEQSSGDFQVARMVGSKSSVIFFWERDMGSNDRKIIVDELKLLDPDRVQVLDVSLDIDSVGWYFITKNDASSWKHYWVPGSMMNGTIMNLKVKTTPTIIVTDSLGKQKYRGNDAVKARQMAESL